MSDAFGLSVFLREIPLLLHPTTAIAPYSEALASQQHLATPKPLGEGEGEEDSNETSTSSDEWLA